MKNNTAKKIVKNQKGFTLTEVMLALLIIGMTSVLLTRMMGFHTSASSAYSKYNSQQFTVHDAFTRLNRDIEAALSVTASDNIAGNMYKTIHVELEDCSRVWKLDSGSLYCDSDRVVEELTADSRFIYGSGFLTVILMPRPTNSGANPINVTKPIVSQYSLVYKK